MIFKNSSLLADPPPATAGLVHLRLEVRGAAKVQRQPGAAEPDFADDLISEAVAVMDTEEFMASMPFDDVVLLSTCDKDVPAQLMACATVNELYVTVGRNRLYAVQGRTSTNDLAERARGLFREDGALSREYNEALAGGR